MTGNCDEGDTTGGGDSGEDHSWFTDFEIEYNDCYYHGEGCTDVERRFYSCYKDNVGCPGLPTENDFEEWLDCVAEADGNTDECYDDDGAFWECYWNNNNCEDDKWYDCFWYGLNCNPPGESDDPSHDGAPGEKF